MIGIIIRKALLEATVILTMAVVVSLLTNTIRRDGLNLFGTDCIKQFRVCRGSIKATDIVDVGKALGLFYNRAAIFIDARSPISYSMGHIPGAFNIPSNGNIGEYEDLISGFSKDSFIVVYDDGIEGSPATELASILKEKGFPNVVSFPGGFSEWSNRGLPVDFGGTSL